MAELAGRHGPGPAREVFARVRSQQDLTSLLRQLRRREARSRSGRELTYRELAAKTGWSHAIIGQYLTGKVLPPTDRFDALIRILGAASAEQGALATARDRIEELRRTPSIAGGGRPGTVPPPGLAARAGAAPDRAPDKPSQVMPRQLPLAARHFTGRQAELAVLIDLADQAAKADGTVVIVVIDGTAGIGKTALAVHAAHRAADRFPDGQLYVNLRGFDPAGLPIEPSDATRGFLDAFVVPGACVPAGFDAQVGLYRSFLAGRRMLVLLDNARDVGQVRPLLPGTPGCLVVVTSRNRLTGLILAEHAQPLTLGLLPATEAHDLLASRLGADRMAAEREAAQEIIDQCAGLPLALSIVASRAAAQPCFPLAALAAELPHTCAGLAGPHSGDPDTDVREVFSWSYHRLPDQSARVFRLLGLHSGPDIGAAAAAALAGADTRPRWPSWPTRTCRQSRRQAVSPAMTCCALTPVSSPTRWTPSMSAMPPCTASMTTTCTPPLPLPCSLIRSGSPSRWPRPSQESHRRPSPATTRPLPGSRGSTRYFWPASIWPGGNSGTDMPGSWPGPLPATWTGAGTGTTGRPRSAPPWTRPGG